MRLNRDESFPDVGKNCFLASSIFSFCLSIALLKAMGCLGTKVATFPLGACFSAKSKVMSSSSTLYTKGRESGEVFGIVFAIVLAGDSPSFSKTSYTTASSFESPVLVISFVYSRVIIGLQYSTRVYL